MPVQRKVFRIEEMLSRRQACRASSRRRPLRRRTFWPSSAALRSLLERQRRRGTRQQRRQVRRRDRQPAPAQERDRHHSPRDQPHQAGDRGAARAWLQRAGEQRASPASSTRWSAAPSAPIQQILAAAEDIDEAANTLSAALKRDAGAGAGAGHPDQVIRIFEACNFQDLTGQRITKVLADAEIHRGAHRAHDGDLGRHRRVPGLHRRRAGRARRQGSVLLNGPKLEGDPGHASQDDIDALFSKSESRAANSE